MARGKSISVTITVLLCACSMVFASPQGPEHAAKAARGWLKQTVGKPMGANLGQATKWTETFSDSQGQALYYVVHLEPTGYVVVPADDEVEPIVAFAGSGVFDPSPQNPMVELLSADMPGRLKDARAEEHKRSEPLHGRFFKAREQWQKLEAVADQVGESAPDVSNISDVRVAPLLTTTWSQSEDDCGTTCYNIYTPNNYVCGCVATAMAQMMKFWEHPISPLTTGPFSVTVDGTTQSKSLRGGNGSGGAYLWSNMVNSPDCSTTSAQRQAIGALTYDAGVAAHMQYSSYESGAWLEDAKTAFVSVFGYSNAICAGAYHSNSEMGTGRYNMLNPNLDAGYPCMIAIYGAGGHAVVVDGYGFTGTTPYHHINMGWAGSSDAWYNLPTIVSFDILSKVIYNMYVTGSGEIISGRVTNVDGDPISGATVTAVRTGGSTYTTTTNAKGIYFFAKVPSNSTYTIGVEYTNSSFDPLTVATGRSVDTSGTSGNVWGADIEQLPNQAGELTNITVTPLNGTSCDEYTFSVHYYDMEGDAPVGSAGTVTLRGTSSMTIPLSLVSGNADDGDYSGTGKVPAGSYGFQISFEDTAGMTAESTWQGGPYVCPCAEMTGDKVVNFAELAIIAVHWRQGGCSSSNSWCGQSDVDQSGVVDLRDLMTASEEWDIRDVSRLSLIPAGEFTMGDSADMSNSTELPLHLVSVDSFYIGRFEVTNAEYCAALNWAYSKGYIGVSGGIVMLESGQVCCDTTTSSTYSRIVWNGSTFSVTVAKEDHPMAMVTWWGAIAYCNWASVMQDRTPCYDLSTGACDRTKDGFRLPTEAEWEYAARGRLAGARYPIGNSMTGSQVNYYDSGDPYQVGTSPYTTPVGFYNGKLHTLEEYVWPSSVTSYQSGNGMNGYQLYDMSGNVHELCNDWYSSTFYRDRPIPDVNPTGPDAGTGRVTRGGSWKDTGTGYCRASWRSGTPPTMRVNTIGFRVASSY